MLTRLNINNVVLIDQLTIDFKHGLCVLTGETGAGKSVLLDSLGLALGVRAESGLVRKGAESARVTASFQLTENHDAHKVLQDADILIEDDLLLMRRVVYTSGKSRAFINDQPVSIGLLKQIGDTLVEIHGQFETQGLLNPATHRSMLDAYAGITHKPLHAQWENWQDAQSKLYELQNLSSRAREEEEYLRLSVQDLQTLDPQKGEEETLASMRERLKNREATLEALNLASLHLNAEDDPVQKAIAALSRLQDDKINQIIATLENAANEISEAAALVQTLYTDLQDEAYNLEEIDDRLHALRMQARKHNCIVDDLPEMLETLAAQLDMIERSDETLKDAQAECEAAKQKYAGAAQKITSQRQKVATKLNALVQKELAPLKLEKARFVTDITPKDEIDWSANGTDQVRFLVATNPGADPGPIHKIASGGEMSRFMLALKVIIAQEGSTHSFIFDEVDAGIGGATADAVGERLARLANSKQVLVVTHAPQVAARANHHMIVQKSGKDVVTTNITPLETREARCEEIARMLAGADITPEARAAADKLMAGAA